jgi:FtsH-binding integral membrane protein
MNSFFSSFSSPVNPLEIVGRAFSERSKAFSASERRHLSLVYRTLVMSIGVAALGCLADLRYHFGGILSLCLSLFCSYIIAQPKSFSDFHRQLALGGSSFLLGASVSPMVRLAIFIDPSLVFMAFLTASVVFAGFSCVALQAPRRSYLYLGSFISSSLLFFLALSILSLFYRNMFIYSLELYGGLLLFCAYVIYDTQVILERAAHGDYIRDSLHLLLDFVNLFVRILAILIKNQQDKQRREEKNKRRSQ